jgi:hypothetical protein
MPADQLVDAFPNDTGHALRSFVRMHHDVGHAAHQVLAKPNLRIHDAAGLFDRTAREITKMCSDRRRTDIERNAVNVAFESRPDRDDLAAVADCDRYLPVLFAQCFLQIG